MDRKLLINYLLKLQKFTVCLETYMNKLPRKNKPSMDNLHMRDILSKNMSNCNLSTNILLTIILVRKCIKKDIKITFINHEAKYFGFTL